MVPCYLNNAVYSANKVIQVHNDSSELQEKMVVRLIIVSSHDVSKKTVIKSPLACYRNRLYQSTYIFKINEQQQELKNSTLLPDLIAVFADRKQRVPFSMVIVKVEFMHKCSSEHLRMVPAEQRNLCIPHTVFVNVLDI